MVGDGMGIFFWWWVEFPSILNLFITCSWIWLMGLNYVIDYLSYIFTSKVASSILVYLFALVWYYSLDRKPSFMASLALKALLLIGVVKFKWVFHFWAYEMVGLRWWVVLNLMYNNFQFGRFFILSSSNYYSFLSIY